MSQHKDLGEPPPYSASVNPGNTNLASPPYDEKHAFLNPKDPRYLPLQIQLANARTERIKSVLSNYVEPLVWEHATSGILKTTVILIPSEITALRHCPNEIIVGFPKDASIQLVRLGDSEGKMEFWRQRAVMSELNASLEADLQGWGAGSVPSPEPAISGSTLQSEDSQVPFAGLPPRPTQANKTSFWHRRRSHQTEPTEQKESPTDFGLTWRTEEEKARDRAKAKGQMRDVGVEVGVKNVCLRVENEMGLYETRTGDGLCIDVELGS